MFVDAGHGNGKVTRRYINGLFSVAGSTPITWSSKLQTAVQTSTFGSEFTVLNKSEKKSIMIQYHLILVGIEVSKPAHIFGDNTSVVFNENNPGSTLKNKTVALS